MERGNIAPQINALNQGPWPRLEQAARDIVCTGTVLWVMTGPLHDGTPAAAPLPNADEPHTVPTGFWKILATNELDFLAAFIFEQDTPRNADVADHLVSVNEVEQRSGLDFFREVDDPQEDVLEGVVLTAAEWNGFVPVQGCILIRP
jgi:endonuclease G